MTPTKPPTHICILCRHQGPGPERSHTVTRPDGSTYTEMEPVAIAARCRNCGIETEHAVIKHHLTEDGALCGTTCTPFQLAQYSHSVNCPECRMELDTPTPCDPDFPCTGAVLCDIHAQGLVNQAWPSTHAG